MNEIDSVTLLKNLIELNETKFIPLRNKLMEQIGPIFNIDNTLREFCTISLGFPRQCGSTTAGIEFLRSRGDVIFLTINASLRGEVKEKVAGTIREEMVFTIKEFIGLVDSRNFVFKPKYIVVYDSNIARERGLEKELFMAAYEQCGTDVTIVML